MKKISILSLHLGYGGIEKSVCAIANLLSTKYEVEIACTYKLYDNPAFELNENVSIKYLTNVKPNHKELKDSIKRKNIFKIIKEVIKGIKVLQLRRKTMIEYIKSIDSNVVISTRDIFDKWLGKYGSNDIVKIGWEHNHHHNNLKYANKITKASSKLDYLVLVSKNLEEFYKEELKTSKCKCVYIPNILEKVPTKVASLKEERLISVGRLSPEKGYLDLLKIYKETSKKYPTWHLDIIGDGKEKTVLEEYIKNNNLEENVRLHGFQNKEYIDNLLNKSSIYLMTSHTESFGIVLIEAMSHGIPCIAFSEAEGARELIYNEKNGYLIENRDFNEYVKKIEELIEDSKLRKSLGKEGRKSIKKYTGEEVIKDWYNLIEGK